jgi:hypothetical protein
MQLRRQNRPPPTPPPHHGSACKPKVGLRDLHSHELLQDDERSDEVGGCSDGWRGDFAGQLKPLWGEGGGEWWDFEAGVSDGLFGGVFTLEQGACEGNWRSCEVASDENSNSRDCKGKGLRCFTCFERVHSILESFGWVLLVRLVAIVRTV